MTVAAAVIRLPSRRAMLKKGRIKEDRKSTTKQVPVKSYVVGLRNFLFFLLTHMSPFYPNLKAKKSLTILR